MSGEAVSLAADALLAAHRRRPLLGWERRDLGYSSPTDRTLSDALKTEKYYNCQKLKQIEEKLQPNDGEIVALVTINPINADKAKAHKIADDVKKCVRFRYWVNFLEPTFDGLPHINLLIRLRKKHLSGFEKSFVELSRELAQAEGFHGITNLKLCDSEGWNNHKKGEWPWPIGYSAKGAYNLDYILSFMTWVKIQGGRWCSESKRCVRTDPSPIGYVPSFDAPNFPIKSIHDELTKAEPDDPKLNTNDPRYYNFEWSEERRNTRLNDELEEWHGRNLNDQLCNQNYGKALHPTYPDLIDKSGLPNDELPQKYINLIKKALESRDESVLVIAQNSLETEREAEIEKAQKPAKEREKRIKTVLAAFLRTSKAIRTKSNNKAIFEVASEINNAVNSEDREALSKFGLTRRNALVFCPSEIKIISQEIHKRITEYDGESETEQKKIMREINNKLRPHLHCLMFAELHIFIQKFREKSQLFTGEKLKLADEILQKIDEKIGAHRKATCQGFWLKRALKKAMNGDAGRLGEMLSEIDFRSDKTRAIHGKKPLKDNVKLVDDHHEVKARQKTKKIRQIELLKAAEAAEKSAQPRIKKPRQPRKKPAENAP